MGNGCSTEGDQNSNKAKDKPGSGSTSDVAVVPVECGYAKDYNENEVHEVKVRDDFSVLLVKYKDSFYAFGTKCPHYGAPLIKGAFHAGFIKCPWHGACFDVKTGDIEEYPGCDAIPSYPVTLDKEGRVVIHARNLGQHVVERPFADVSKEHTTVIIGSGASAITAAQTMREFGYAGRIMMVTKDAFLPYDRTKLSKLLGPDWDNIKLRGMTWFKKAQIETLLKSSVKQLDVQNKSIAIDGRDEPLKYDQVLIATGMKPRVPAPKKDGGVIGSDLGNVLSLHDLKNSAEIKKQCTGKTVVIMGAGFIGMELLGPLNTVAEKVFLIHRSKYPYGHVFGDLVGQAVLDLVCKKYEKNLEYIGSDTIKEIVGNGNHEVQKIITQNNREIECQVVVFAIGGIPSTGFISQGNPGDKETLLTDSSGFVGVNEYMETDVKDHFACGDCTKFPLEIAVAKRVQIGHWGLAQKMGRIAGLRMLIHKPEDAKTESIYNTVPFFWHSVAGINLRYVGYGEQYDQMVIYGDLKSYKFCVLYTKANRILAALTCSCDPLASKLSFDIGDRNAAYGPTGPTYIKDVFPDPPVVQ